MSDELSPRAARLKRAAELLYGARGGTRFAGSIGISKQLYYFVVTGERPLTMDVEQRAADALGREAKRLRATAATLDAIAKKMKAS